MTKPKGSKPQIILAKTAGFCFGVERAVNTVYQQLALNKSISTLGPIIHNPQVVDQLKKAGVEVVNSVDEVKTDAVVIRSHGVGKAVLKALEEKGVEVIDATCPYVKKIQKTVEDAYNNGMQIVIIGEANHPEVIGINGYCDNTAYVLNSVQDAENLDITAEKLCVVAQTTSSQKKWQQIVEVLNKKGYNMIKHDTICHATAQRQAEAEEITKKSDAVIVIGGANSSNTHKLYELCKAHCNNTYVVESVEDLSAIDIKNFKTIGVTAGASTPDWVIKEVITRMSEQEMLERQYSNFEEEMDKTMVKIYPGQQIKGTVVYVNDFEVGVNIGYKSDGFISKDELTVDGNINPRYVVKEGDVIEVEILKVNDGNGNVILSKKAVEQRLAKDKTLSFINDGNVFEAKVKEAVKGGLTAEVDGIKVFIPASQIKLHGFAKDLAKFVGETFKIKALEVDTKKRRVVASRSLVLKEEKSKKSEEFWSNIKEGDVRKGIVRRITDFGAFVDIGGFEGLLHIGDMAWYRVDKVTDILAINDEIDVVVLSLDREKEMISLGLKQLQPKPWDFAAEKYPVGSRVRGTVVRTAPFGAFVALEPGIDAMVHISEIANAYIKRVEDALKIGQEVEAVVLNTDPEQKRISLSIKALHENDEEAASETQTESVEEETQEN